MEVQGLEFLPILWSAWTFVGFITLYILTIINGHAESYFLYISETGDYFPESILFAVVFVVSAVFDAFLSYCMYKYYIIKSSKLQHCYPHLQYTILGLGWLACVGTIVVATFPAVTYPIPHKIAAAISFLGSAIRNTCQSVLVYKLSFNSQTMCHVRMAISITTIICLIILFISRLIWWQICSASLCLYITENIAIATEWIGAIGLLLYKLTHCEDFQHLVLKLNCNFRDNWLFFRDTEREIQNDQLIWRSTRRSLPGELTPLPLLFTKTGLHWCEEKKTKYKTGPPKQDNSPYTTPQPHGNIILHFVKSELLGKELNKSGK